MLAEISHGIAHDSTDTVIRLISENGFSKINEIIKSDIPNTGIIG